MYTLAGEIETAMTCYDKEANSLLQKGNYLAAAKLIEERLKAPNRAMHILRRGWIKRKQPEACLTHFFFKLPKEEWPPLITQFFDECHSNHYSSFLDVLLNLRPEQQPDNLQQLFREIALRAVSTMLKQGQGREQYLTHFITEDRLLPIDLQRLKKLPKVWQRHFYRSFSLNQDGQSRIIWQQLIRFFNFTLALGKSEDEIVIARADSRGYVQLKKTHLLSTPDFTFLLNCTGYEESTYHITSGRQRSARHDTWRGGTVFPDVHLVKLNLVGNEDKAVGMASGDRVVQLHLKEGECFLNRYGVEGRSISIASRMPFPAKHVDPTDKIGRRLIRTKGNYFFTCSKISLFMVEGDQLHISEPLDRNSYTDYDARDGGEESVHCLYATTDGVSLYHFDKRNKVFHLHQRISVKGEIAVARYLSSKAMLIALRKGHWYLYVQPKGETHDQWRRYRTLPLPSQSGVVDVLTNYPSRSSFSLLCRDGQIYFYDLREWLMV